MLYLRNYFGVFGCLLGLLLGMGGAMAGEGFPGRAEFPAVPVYELGQLHAKLGEVTVVDARSPYEFETLRIKDARNIPVAAKSFEEEVAKLRASTDKPIVFYCNGRSCYKSYIAVKKAREARVDNVYAYDAGIFEWAQAYPRQAVLLDKSPINPKDLIPNERFKARLLDPDSFSDRATRPDRSAMVLDVRDKFQRAGIGFYPGRERWVSLDQKEKLTRYIQKALRENKTLLVYDEVGKQVRWLQYALEKAGVKKYYFMHKGASGYFEHLAQLDKQP
jgi:rhodanese-related sulfurtransferase